MNVMIWKGWCDCLRVWHEVCNEWFLIQCSKMTAFIPLSSTCNSTLWPPVVHRKLWQILCMVIVTLRSSAAFLVLFETDRMPSWVRILLTGGPWLPCWVPLPDYVLSCYWLVQGPIRSVEILPKDVQENIFTGVLYTCKNCSNVQVHVRIYWWYS